MVWLGVQCSLALLLVVRDGAVVGGGLVYLNFSCTYTFFVFKKFSIFCRKKCFSFSSFSLYRHGFLWLSFSAPFRLTLNASSFYTVFSTVWWFAVDSITQQNPFGQTQTHPWDIFSLISFGWTHRHIWTRARAASTHSPLHRSVDVITNMTCNQLVVPFRYVISLSRNAIKTLITSFHHQNSSVLRSTIKSFFLLFAHFLEKSTLFCDGRT